MARANVGANGFPQRIAIAEGSFDAFAAGNQAAFDQVISNPPFFEQGRHTRSPRETRAAAHGEEGLDLAGWIKAAAISLKPGGRLTVIHRADRLGELLRACEGRFGAIVIFPLWPKPDVEAGRIILRAIKGRRTLPRLLTGLVLHRTDGAYSPQAEAILRDAAALDLGKA